MFYVVTTAKQLFDISTNKATEISTKNTFKTIYLQGKELYVMFQ